MEIGTVRAVSPGGCVLNSVSGTRDDGIRGGYHHVSDAPRPSNLTLDGIARADI